VELAPDGQIAAGDGTLVSDVALSLSDWDVSSVPYACLSQMRSLGRDLAKTTAKLVEHPELVAGRIITFAEIVGQENVIAGTDCGLGGPRPSANRMGQAARPARQRGDSSLARCMPTFLGSLSFPRRPFMRSNLSPGRRAA